MSHKPKASEKLRVEHWRKALLPADATLKQVINNLDETAFQIALIVTSDNVLVGTLTDGDVRRGLLQGMDMGSLINDIVFPAPLVVPPEMAHEMVLQLMHANKIRQIPIVDEKRCVMGLHLYDDLTGSAKLPNLMVIMAGGQGARLRPQTETCPKPMLPVAGKPMLEHIITGAKLEGFQHFVLSIHYLGHMIEEYFGNGERLGVKVDYLREETPLGTAGALSLLSPLPDAPFVVTNGDVITDIRCGDMLDYHCRQGASATMAVRIHEWQHPFGVVRTKGVEITDIEEKPVVRNHINAGVYVLEPDVIDNLNTGEHCDMPTLFSRLQGGDARAIVYPMHEPWLDVGRMGDLEQAQKNHQKNS